MEPIKINQSTVKRLDSTTVCPQRYYREEVTLEHKRPASEAMVKGQRFEYITFGTKNREGQVPIIPALKKGGKSTDEVRIEAQSKRLLEVFKALNIKIVKTDWHTEYLVNGMLVHSTQDILADWDGEPYILDCKLTANVNSTFGAYSSWGLYDKLCAKFVNHKVGDDVKVYVDQFDALKFKQGKQMDMLQPHTYMYHMELKTKAPWKFAYAVADYKPKPEIKIIKIIDTKEGRVSMLNRTSDTRERIQYFRGTNFAPIPSWDECSECPVKNCMSRINAKPSFNGIPEFTMFDEAPLDLDRIPVEEPVVVHTNPDEDPFA
jgi:hypothetical protein